ncbi:MAG TPA: hypothetical protein VJ672_13840 [Gemmatimonadaceae bacterium]|nr:hypothetical protein [Gemmatimonadaceae bacterium]
MTGGEPNTERFVSASELAEYAYCRRAWWLRAVQGIETVEHSERFERGHKAHRAHGNTLRAARLLAFAAIALLIGALLYLLSR